MTISLVEETSVGWGNIDHVLLVGGSIKMPMVARMLEEIAGKPPLRSGNPDELVALGAGIQAAAESPQPDVPTPKIVVKDVTSQGLGVLANDHATNRMRNFVLIPRNVKIPATASDVFETVGDGQTELRLTVTQGDDDDPTFIRKIGEQVLPIPPYPKGAPIKVEFAYDIDQTVSIAVFDLTSDSSLGSFEIDNAANLTEEALRQATENNNDTEVG